VGLPRMESSAVTPRAAGARRLRAFAHSMPINRLLLAWDLSAVLVVVAVVELLVGSTRPEQVLVIVLAVDGCLVAFGHLLSILLSARLR